MLAFIKRNLDYDIIGRLFRDMYLGVNELTVVENMDDNLISRDCRGVTYRGRPG